MKKKTVIENLIVSTLTQLITLILGMILPRLILLAWGSEYNGLLSSVTNILRYLSLLEAGFNTATLQALYKSVGQDDQEQTSIVIRTSQHYYHRISLIYALMVLLISIGYPLIVKSEIPFWETFIIIILQGAVGVINFAFRAAYQQLLNAEGKYYVISLITLLTTVLTYVAKILSIGYFNSVVIMQIMSVLVIIVQVTIYAIYFKRRYTWIDKDARIDESLLENRRYYFTQQVAGLIFNSTDTFVLSVFCGLKVASVYATYNLVYTALAQIISLIRGSTSFVLGQSFHKDESFFKRVYDAYSAMQSMIGGIMASISMVLIINFIQLYTQGINDINYIDFIAALLFSFNLMLECSRGASLASAINLISSLILVQFVGMKGVLLGTAIAGLYRTTDSIIYTNIHVLNRSSVYEFKNVFVDFALFFGVVYVSHNVISINAISYIQLVGYAVVTGIIVTAVYGFAFIVLNKNVTRDLIQAIKHD
mgnify:CR=1 FL=1